MRHLMVSIWVSFPRHDDDDDAPSENESFARENNDMQGGMMIKSAQLRRRSFEDEKTI